MLCCAVLEWPKCLQQVDVPELEEEGKEDITRIVSDTTTQQTNQRVAATEKHRMAQTRDAGVLPAHVCAVQC